MSAQDKLDRRAAKHGLGSDERKRKIQKSRDFFSKPVPSYSKDELRKMGHPVESSAEYGKSIDRIRDKEKNAAIKPKDRDTLGKLADLMKKQKRNEAYRKPTQAEIDADKRKERKGKDSSTRYKNMKKKMYGNAMGSLKVETNESSLPPHLQKIIGKNGQIDKKKVDQHVHGKKTKVTDVTPKGYGPKEDVDEATMADRAVMKAVRIAKDMAGNHTGASKRIEKMKKGLSDHPKVRDALRTANESVSSADRKPQNFRDPETGKMKVRMVPVDRDVVRGDDKARVVRKKRFKQLRSK